MPGPEERGSSPWDAWGRLPCARDRRGGSRQARWECGSCVGGASHKSGSQGHAGRSAAVALGCHTRELALLLFKVGYEEKTLNIRGLVHGTS